MKKNPKTKKQFTIALVFLFCVFVLTAVVALFTNKNSLFTTIIGDQDKIISIHESESGDRVFVDTDKQKNIVLDWSQDNIFSISEMTEDKEWALIYKSPEVQVEEGSAYQSLALYNVPFQKEVTAFEGYLLGFNESQEKIISQTSEGEIEISLSDLRDKIQLEQAVCFDPDNSFFEVENQDAKIESITKVTYPDGKEGYQEEDACLVMSEGVYGVIDDCSGEGCYLEEKMCGADGHIKDKLIACSKGCIQGICEVIDTEKASCNQECVVGGSSCEEGLYCKGEDGVKGGMGVCVNPDCPEDNDQDCVCGSGVIGCNDPCADDTQCREDFGCYNGNCRLRECPSQQNCICEDCLDSDGDDPTTKGTMLLRKDGRVDEFVDHCSKATEGGWSNQVVEFYCNSERADQYGIKKVDCPSGTVCEDGACVNSQSLHTFTLQSIEDANNNGTGDAYCQSKGLTCAGVEWYNKQDAYPSLASQNGGWWQQYACSGNYLTDETYKDSVKKVNCEGDYNQEKTHYFILESIEDAEGNKTPNEFCQSKGLSCISGDWYYKNGGSNNGWAPLSETGGYWRSYWCTNNQLLSEDFKNSAKRIVCEGKYDNDQTNSYLLTSIKDANGNQSPNEFCQEKGSTCVSGDWYYKGGGSNNGWAPLTETGGFWRPYSCSNKELLDETFAISAKRINCKKTTTQTTACGNGILEIGEECDDGNHTAGDGCEACTITQNNCPTLAPANCNNATPIYDHNNCITGYDCHICGDGVVSGDEECDDGNITSGDLCETDCTTSQNCIPAGKGSSPALGVNDPYSGMQCCEGLTSLQNYYNTETCQSDTGDGNVCANCGDEICSQYENKCNCPSDCTTQTPTWHRLTPAEANVLTTINLDNDSEDDIVASFPDYGTWIFKNKDKDYNDEAKHGWERISTVKANLLTAADVDGDGTDEIIGSYDGYGTWLYQTKNKTWYRLSTGVPTHLQAFDYDGDNQEDIVGSYGSGGTWIFQNKDKDYNNESIHGWKKITWAGADALTTADVNNNGKDEIIGNFTTYGVYMYKDNAWHHLSAGKANILKTLDIDGDNQEDIVGNFPEYGTWIFQDKNRDYSNTEIHGWEKITGSPATVITTADVNSDGTDAVIGAYEGYGTWLYHGPNKKWYLLSTGMAENLTPFDFDGDNETDIIGSYGSGGTWIFQNKNKDYNNQTKHGWIKITWVGGNPITTADIDNSKKEEPIGSYEGYGVWVYKR